MSLPPSHASSHRRAVALMMVSAAAFTANVLLVRGLANLHAANIWLVSCSRFVVGLGLVATIYRREFKPHHLYRNPKLVQRGLIGAVGVYLTYLTVVKLGAGRAVFIGNSYVVWGALMAAWLLGEKLRPGVVVGGLAALAGIALLTHVFSTTVHPGLYDALAVVTALLSAYVIITIRQLHGVEHTSTIFAAQCAYGLLLCSVPAYLTFEPISAAAWGLMLAAAITAGIGQLAMTRAFRELPVAEGSLIQMLVPLGIALGGSIIFHESFAPLDLAGAALILGGTMFTALSAGRRPARPAT